METQTPNEIAPKEAGGEASEAEASRVEVRARPSSRTVAATPRALKFVMLGTLLVAVVGLSIFAYVRQTSIKPPTPEVGADSCEDPITENRLTETLRQNANDFATLYDLSFYRLECSKDPIAAAAGFKQAIKVGEADRSKIQGQRLYDVYFGLGRAYFDQGNVQDATATLEGILKEKPDYNPANLVLGLIKVCRDPARAKLLFEAAIKDSNADIVAQANSGLRVVSDATLLSQACGLSNPNSTKAPAPSPTK